MKYLAPRLATLVDVDTLVRQRAEMMAELNTSRDRRLEVMATEAHGWFRKHVATGTYIGFLIAAADDSATPIAGGGLWLLDWPPTHRDPQPLRGYILNVYVDPPHRRRGLARAVTEACLEACRARGIRTVSLHAADAARPIYERLGFVPTNEMRLEL